MQWNPNQYLTFENHRLRPALDLLGRVNLDSPKRIVDLGSGTGNVTQIISERWPKAKVTGIDNSPEMLKKARDLAPNIDWKLADVKDWEPKKKLDLIYSNATLHWLDDHESLFPKLLGHLKPGGALAVQMPGNFTQPTHMLVYEAARSGPWRDKLEHLIKPPPVMEPSDYYRILSPHAKQVDVWETRYMQVLEGENPVAEWTKGTWLKPFLDALEGEERDAFEQAYRRLILEAYPPGPDGKTLLPFRRIFMVATV